MTGKEKAFAALHDSELRNEALVYLYYDCNVGIDELAKLTYLALSTVNSYLYKFRKLLALARLHFNIIVEDLEENYYVYIDKVTMPNGETWCKIGQTTKTPEERASKFKWGQLKPAHVDIMHVIECKDFSAMNCLEDCLRIAMISLNPGKFCKEDRLLWWEDDYPERILNNPFVQMGIKEFAI